MDQDEEPMGDISVPDIAVPDISQIKTELDIKKEAEEPVVKEETDDTTGDVKPKEEQPDIKSEPGTLYIYTLTDWTMWQEKNGFIQC